MIDALKRMKVVWGEAFREMSESLVMKRLADGEMTIEHYKAILKQIFHHVRENPQIQAAATMYFRGDQRESIKVFFKHATSEIGHDMLALSDYAACGGDPSKVRFEKPIPATTALVAYPLFQIQYRNPVGYLGYLFFVEFTPTEAGNDFIEKFQKIGVPDTALSFLNETATTDLAHMRLMEKYVEGIIHSEEDLDEVCYAIRVTARLYTRMIEEAVQSADQLADFGESSVEALRSNSTQASDRGEEAQQKASFS